MFWRKSNRNWVREILWPFKSFFLKIKRLIKFTPIIWNSYDWDYVYSVDLFKFQLLRMADYMEKHDHLENNTYNARRIRTVCKLMDKVYNEEYIDQAHDKLELLYGEEAFRLEPIPTGNGEDIWRMAYKSYPNAKDIKETSRRLYQESLEKQNKAHRLLWKLIEHNIRGWWD